MRGWRWWGVVVVVALRPLSAAAEPTIVWERPDECPSTEASRDTVAALLRTPIGELALPLTAAVHIRRVADVFEATIAIRAGGAVRTRVLRDRDCAVLAHAAAVVVALAIDDSARQRDGRGASGSRARNSLRPDGGGVSGPDSRRTLGSDGRSSRAGDSAVASDSALMSSPSNARPNSAPTVTAVPTARERAASESAVDSQSERGAGTPEAFDRASANANAIDSSAAPPRVPTPRRDPAPERAPAEVRAPEPEISESDDADFADASDEVDSAHVADTEPARASAIDRGNVGFALGIAGALGVGVLPNVAPGVAISAAFVGPSWRLGLRVGYAPAQRSEVPNPPANLPRPSTGAGGKVALASASIDGGLRWQFSSFEVPLVAGVEAGLFDSVGQNVPNRARRSAAWLATYLGSGIGLQLTPGLAAGVRVEGLIALLRPEFALNHGNEPLVFYQPRALGGRVSLGLEARWR